MHTGAEKTAAPICDLLVKELSSLTSLLIIANAWTLLLEETTAQLYFAQETVLGMENVLMVNVSASKIILVQIAV